MTDITIKAEPMEIRTEISSGGIYLPPSKPSEQPKVISSYHTAGLLIDQQTKYQRPDEKQLSFDSLQDNTKKAIEEGGPEITETIEGIKLSASEKKVVDCICKLFHEKSQTYKPTEKDYYTGNAGFEVITYGGEQTIAPKIKLTLYELTNEYTGGYKVAGKDIQNVNKVLKELSKKQFLTRYTETTHTKDGIDIERGIEEYLPLIRIPKYFERTSKNNIELSKKEETLIVLNPIFRRQIADKYISYPSDILKRTIEAYGSSKVSMATFNLRDYLKRGITCKHTVEEIYEKNLHAQLAPDLVRQGRRKQLLEATNKAIDVSMKLGLVTDYKIVTSYKGRKYVFFLNQDWK